VNEQPCSNRFDAALSLDRKALLFPEPGLDLKVKDVKVVEVLAPLSVSAV
jgi:hypothetical protein